MITWLTLQQLGLHCFCIILVHDFTTFSFFNNNFQLTARLSSIFDYLICVVVIFHNHSRLVLQWPDAVRTTYYLSVIWTFTAQAFLFLSVMACRSLKRTPLPVPVRGINVVAYLPLVQPTENHPNLVLNPGYCSRQPVRPSRHCHSESALGHCATENADILTALYRTFCQWTLTRDITIFHNDNLLNCILLSG